MMVRIRYRHTANDCFVELKGHADFGPHGKDVLCSSISTIICMLGLACRQAKERGEIKELIFREEPGDTMISFTYVKPDSRARYIAEVVMESYRTLAGQFPKHLLIEESG